MIKKARFNDEGNKRQTNYKKEGWRKNKKEPKVVERKDKQYGNNCW